MNEILEHNNIRVLTTQQLAEALNTNSKVISKNFQRNIKNFKKGKHYFVLTGKDLKQFKATRQNDETLKFTSVLYLWTEQGVLMHAKHLKNERAQQAINALIADYFQNQKFNQSNLPQVTHERFIALEQKVEELIQQIREVTIHSADQNRVRKAVAGRVQELAKMHKKPTQFLYRALYTALKKRYEVISYRDIKQYQLKDALMFIETWDINENEREIPAP